MKRRDFLKAVTAAVALPEAFVSLPSFAADTIKVGILHSLSGTMAISETALKETALMTIAEINANGGVMGKMIDAQSIVVASTATNWYGHEGSILRYVFLHSIVLACLVGLFVTLQAYVYPFTAMVLK